MRIRKFSVEINRTLVENTPQQFTLEYYKEIPKEASQQEMFVTEGKASERFRPYQYVLLKEDLTHR